MLDERIDLKSPAEVANGQKSFHVGPGSQTLIVNHSGTVNGRQRSGRLPASVET